MSTIQRQRRGWYLYDFANSGFSTSVITVFFGPYLTMLAITMTERTGQMSFLGMHVHPGAVYSYCVSLSVLLQVAIMPLLGSYIDATHRKRLSLLVTSSIGACATIGMYVLDVQHPNPIVVGAMLFVLANVAFGASIVASNSFLNDLAAPSERDTVSSRGWALGYLGGGLLLVIHLYMYSQWPDSINVILASTGLWWLVFSIASVVLLKDPPAPSQRRRTGIIRQAWTSLKGLREHPSAFRFLIAYLIYNETVQTAISMASIYGKMEMRVGDDVLILGILLVQFVALFGALLFNRIASLLGTLNAILISIAGWAFALGAALVIPPSDASFYGLAVTIAVVLGGIQALSRSYFSTLIPEGTEAEYFALYEISDKGTSWIGPLLFGVVVSVTASYRLALASLAIFLVVGALLLLQTKRRGLVS
jgi:UMF1 family MFS transporter